MVKKDETLVRIRIKVKAYDNKVIDKSIKQIIDICNLTGVSVVGPIPLPTHIKKITVNKSTFVHKDSREQYEMRTHKRFIDIINPSQKTMESLIGLELPAGVDVEIKM